MHADMPDHSGIVSQIVSLFLRSRLSLVFIMVTVALGLSALWLMPKEEEPQIIVPTADIIVSVPGADAEEVQKLVATPLEQFLWQLDEVEDVYSSAENGRAVVSVRFYVGTDQEDALVRLYNQTQMNIDAVPTVVDEWIIKPVSIDDVPIVNIVLHSDQHDDFTLRQVGQELLTQLTQLDEFSKAYLIGGRELQARIIFDATAMAGFQVTPLDIFEAIAQSDVSITTGSIKKGNQEINVQTRAFISKPSELEELVVSVHNNKPVYLRDVAQIKLGPEEASHYSQYYSGQTATGKSAVTLAIAKKSGTNAVHVAERILTELNRLQQSLVPAGIGVEITRNYGETASTKVNELMTSLGLAIVTVIGVLMLFMGWREALIVAVSVPICFALALFVDYLLGYTINRVTLFALILSLGLVVDDPITNVENIQRHFFSSQKHRFQTIIDAVNEVLPPVIMATLTIIASFLPLFFITGMMGPYMSPMAATVPLTILFSTVVALTIVPKMADYLLQPAYIDKLKQRKQVTPVWIAAFYRRLLMPFLNSRAMRYGLALAVILALLGCALLVYAKAVPLKLLPFDNKSELHLVIDLPEGSSLEKTNKVVTDFADYLQQSAWVANFTTYVGVAPPTDFNGLVRQYYFRQLPNLASIQVNLYPKAQRSLSSHDISLSLRRDLTNIAERAHAKLAIVETPPGPPVLQTLVAEVTGDHKTSYSQLIAAAEQLEALLQQQDLVVDVDLSTQTSREEFIFIVDKEKAALNGISATQIAQTLRLALGQTTPMTIHNRYQRQPIQIHFEVPRADRSNTTDLLQLAIKGQTGQLIPLIELGEFKASPHSQIIRQKNLQPIVYVLADTAGRPPVDVILSMSQQLRDHPLPDNIKVNWSGEGAWDITVTVFRDLGLGFAAALIAIYILLFIQTNSFLLPLIMMTAIPLTIIGIIPGFSLLNLIANQPIDGFPTPVFFTATSMIGMLALGGIVIRNSVILIDFINKTVDQGEPFKEAVLKSGAVRLRPIFLTAITVALAAWPITFDPIFSGLAWALIFGVFASTLFSLLIVPVTYFALSPQRRAT